MDTTDGTTITLSSAIPSAPLPSLSSTFRLKTSLCSELSDAVGNLSTYIGLDLSTTLIFTALYNSIIGLLFGKLLFKTSHKCHLPFMALLHPSNHGRRLLHRLHTPNPRSHQPHVPFYGILTFPVVRGIQLSQGLSFAVSAISYIRYIQRPFLGPDSPLRPPSTAAAKHDIAAFSPLHSSSSY